VLNNLGLVHQDLGNYQKADEFLRKALKIQESVGEKRVIANLYNDLGTNLLKMGLVNKSINYYNTSIEIARDIGARPELKENYEQLIIAHARLREYEKSKKYMEAFSAIDDSTRLVDIEEELTMMNEQETKPDTSKYYYYLLAAALLLLVTVVAVFWRYMR
jgi:tetratricopeptide (TPR) repeat protein